MNPKIIDLYNEYIHGDLPRRSFLRRLAGIAGSAAVASTLLPLVESNYAWGQQVATNDPRLVQGYVEYPGTVGKVRAFFARPSGLTSHCPAFLSSMKTGALTRISKMSRAVPRWSAILLLHLTA